MSEPLIVVEGNLRLPALRALTDPSLNFGCEWSPARTRPVQTKSEFALFAARFLTAYVPALGLSEVGSPYRAASLWGVFAKEDTPRSMLHLMQGLDASANAGEAQPDPIHLAVGAVAGTPKFRFSKPVATAIAAACGLLIVWLLFGHETAPQDDAHVAPAAKIAVAAQPAEVEPVQTPVNAAAATTPDEQPKLAPASAALAKADADGPVIRNPEAGPVAPAAMASAEPKHVDRVPAVSAAQTKPAAERAHASRERVVKKDNTRRAQTAPVEKIAKQKPASRTRATADESIASLPAKQKSKPRTHVAPVDTIARRVQPAPVEHVADQLVKRETVRRTRVTPADTIASRPSNASLSMDPTTLYSMLQHSPTLDSNAASSGGGAAKGAR
ncbi:hypothetical protein AWB76_04324 [Caballeronia temeraria]|uniref:Uncharacterized protein n=1 Tax=Caballeronia temeraria TaxID=1777137 RepID=A0A158BLJ1_9BURK|nr:hypothetical protein [Caballeronia temeraria]SAK70177.1 hypothetical protein AWB76_04324 [Caballeronia temeraria]